MIQGLGVLAALPKDPKLVLSNYIDRCTAPLKRIFLADKMAKQTKVLLSKPGNLNLIPGPTE